MLLTDPLFAMRARRFHLLGCGKQQRDGGALPRGRLDLQRAADELGPLAHGQETDGLLVARRLHDVEADSVIGDVQHPVLARALPRHADGIRLRVLVYVLERLLHDAIHGELLHRRQPGVHGVEPVGDTDATARLPLPGVVAHRLREAKLAELGRTEVVDHRAHRVERAPELPFQVRELGTERLPDLGRRALGDALEVLDLEDRVRQDLRGAVMDVAVEPLLFGLEALEDALRDRDGLLLRLVRGRIDARPEQLRGARLDVLHDDLQLLQTAIPALRLLVRVARRAAGPILGLVLVGAAVWIDLLTKPADVAPQRFDDRVELRLEIFCIARDARGLTHPRVSLVAHSANSGP